MEKISQKRNLIEDQDNFFPEFLFYSNEEKSSNISPAAKFDPSSALDGRSPFQNSTAPSKEKIKKKIIIDSLSFEKSCSMSHLRTK